MNIFINLLDKAIIEAIGNINKKTSIWTVPEASYATRTANIFVYGTNSIGANNVHFQEHIW